MHKLRLILRDMELSHTKQLEQAHEQVGHGVLHAPGNVRRDSLDGAKWTHCCHLLCVQVETLRRERAAVVQGLAAVAFQAVSALGYSTWWVTARGGTAITALGVQHSIIHLQPFNSTFDSIITSQRLAENTCRIFFVLCLLQITIC